IGIAPAPINDLRYLVYPWVVDCRTLREAGWRPAYDNAAVLRALMEARAAHRASARRIPRKEAAITAAGATVARVGTAAIVGVVRDHDGPREVTRLSYSAHPSAEAELRIIAEKVAADFDVRALAAVHRLGELGVGDIAVVVAAACPHRAEAFEACRALIDNL